MAKVISSDQFQEKVLNSSEVVLVDFFAEWCRPCKMVAPILEELSSEVEGAKIFKIDVEKSADLAQKYSVMGVPTLILFKNGKALEKIMGFQPKESLKAKLEQY